MSSDIVWRILFAAYFCAAFVTPQLVASRLHFGLPSGLCYSQPIDCTVCNQVQVQVHLFAQKQRV